MALSPHDTARIVGTLTLFLRHEVTDAGGTPEDGAAVLRLMYVSAFCLLAQHDGVKRDVATAALLKTTYDAFVPAWHIAIDIANGKRPR